MTARKPPSKQAASRPPQFVEKLAVALERDGFPRIAGRMYALLLISDDDMSLDDIAARIGASKASASVNARLLEDKSLVVRISRTGDRRNYYRISPELFTCTMEQRLARWDRVRAVVGEGLADSSLSSHARARLREFDKASESIRELLEAALRKLRNRGKS